MLMQNEFFSISERDGKLYITPFGTGFPIRDFQRIIEAYPRIHVTNFLALKKALEEPGKNAVEFGKLKPQIDITISPDNLEAKIHINLTAEEFEEHKEQVVKELLELLEKNKIVYGILYDVINKDLSVKTDIVIARGVLPKSGADASINYLDLPEKRPKITDDGSVDYYEMNLFRHVEKGERLGEKVLPRAGEPGMNIKGDILPAKAGNDRTLRFDKESVEVLEVEGRVLLLAKITGALQVKEGKIGVVDHLIIHGNIGYETGNINFKGYVTIEGIVEDGFSVQAGKDISILGDIGIGAVEKIVSNEGSIYIKGGISGKGKTYIEARQNVFTKYANNCTIKAGDTISIGYYTVDSQLEADNIVIEAKNGRTIGGSIEAKTKVALRTVGNIYDKKTYVKVYGFDRKAMKQELDKLLMNYKKLLEQAEKNERELKIYETALSSTDEIRNTEEYIRFYKNHEELLHKIFLLEEERKSLMRMLTSKGDGEISIFEKAYPQTFLEIKNIQKRIKEVTTGTFYAVDNQLIFD
ncbi:DUF342 domain-containing protein [Geosporobacter ferrireducens]|uniref:Flagellar Assembly Protein A N-terminal region domain-containing protein n=1 Tax=Geosporobacter ferrireducens TaxID=1424294 RepID=A0A1D8GEU1_9FIRM|nr:FapA family protein [Geosporobacter ferrireducens]AOT69429.1 hypothetical protein Gferi_07505 [Geosporobacter ferrireducens]